ncbi:MAG: adenylyltransferase/cytidyltransferase family protein [Patescibacteria group bacterium]|jgi:D-beta-D-heptose 7-phosphate kinase/D-beta-D-heptose 1-phosphate adenosyltransferase
MKTVLVFGSFDGLHPGHEAMLKQARGQGEHVVAALAPDNVIERIKGRMPKFLFEERRDALMASGLVDQIATSDKENGTYNILNRVHPDIVAFGYDQVELKENFLKFLEKTGKQVKTVTLSPFEPDKYKSSKIV